MKKMLILTMLLIVASTSFAQFKFSGTMRVRGNVNNIATYPNYDLKSYPWTQILLDNTSNTSSWTIAVDSTSANRYACFSPGMVDSLASETNLPTEKFADIRFRPTLEYKVNDNLNAVWTAEIGDINFGNSTKGGAQGADGVNVETKNLFFDWIFYPGHKVRAGIQNYMDPMVMVVEDDFAGVVVESSWDILNIPELTTKAGWLKGRDNGNGNTVGSTTILSNVVGRTYDYGYSNYIFDVKLSPSMNNVFGVNFLYQNYTEDVSKPGTKALFSERLFEKSIAGYNLVNYNRNEVWIAPYFKGRPIYNLTLEAELVFNTRSAGFDVTRGKLRDSVFINPTWYYGKNMDFLKSPKYMESGSGMAFMGKVNYRILPELDCGFNLLYASGEELNTAKDSVIYLNETGELKMSNGIIHQPRNFYHGASSFSVFSKQTTTGLEILGTNGVNDSRGISPTLFGDYFGTVLPVFYTNYKLTKDYSIGLAYGSAMTAARVYYQTITEVTKEVTTGTTTTTEIEAVKKNDNRSRNIGSEFDIVGSMTFDKLVIKPTAAFFFPGDLMQVATKSNNTGHGNIITETGKAPMMYEIG